jgi:hypothetical protein
MAEPLRGYAGCNRKPGPNEDFQTAFGKARQGMEGLTAPTRDNMLTFARRHGNIRLEGIPLDRGVAPPDKPQMTLEHTMTRSLTETSEQVWGVLDDMVNLARTIES